MADVQVDVKERRARMLQMAFPLYLSYLTSDQKPATACFVPQGAHPARTVGVATTPGGAKPMEGGPIPMMPIDTYEDMFHEIAKKFYGEGALPGQGTDNGGGGGTAGGGGGGGGGTMQVNHTSTGELGLMDLDYQTVAKDHYGAGNGTATTIVVQAVAPVVQGTDGSATLVGGTSSDHSTHSGKKKTGKKHSSSGNLNGSGGGGGGSHAKQAKLSDSTWVESEEGLSWNSSKVASYNATHKLFRCLECGCVGFLARVAEHWLGSHANLRVFQCPRCPYTSSWARCVRMHLSRQHNEQNADASLWKENPVLEEVTKFLLNLKVRVESKDDAPAVNNADKRYCCPYCPYATDRRDLFTRHENIHSEEKPFRCYVCQKQFNRADHCKKHFTRMHRDHAYDLLKIKKEASNAHNVAHNHSNHDTTTTNLSLVQTPKPNNNLATLSATTGTPVQVQFYTTVAPAQNAVQAAPTTVQLQVQNAPAARPPNYPHPGLPAFPSQPLTTAQTPYKSYTTLGVEALVRPVHNNVNATANVVATPVSSSNAAANNNASSGSSSSSSGGGGGGGASGEKKKREKLYACTYCAWRGVDNWCLKRHLNTHIKPFLCVLCDYKAARTERLATHVLKVHNKRICNKCNFLADDQESLAQHLRGHQ